MNKCNFIVDRKMPKQMINKLSSIGNVYLSARVNTSDKSIDSHPDLQIHFISDNTAVVAPSVYEYYRKHLPRTLTLIKGIYDIGFTYPQNCAYNIVRFGKNIVCKTSCAEKTILDYYRQFGFKVINVKQGYAKCNICPISDKAFITEDKGIYNSVKKADESISIFLIESGSVRLDGFDCGFIGGASGKLGNSIFFCGNALLNPQLKAIIEYNNINAVMLSDDEMYDFGSIITF